MHTLAYHAYVLHICMCAYMHGSFNHSPIYNIYIYIYIIYIYIKLSPKWKNVQEQKVFFVRFYILCENFSKIGPIIKKIPKFWDDPLNPLVPIAFYV